MNIVKLFEAKKLNDTVETNRVKDMKYVYVGRLVKI